MTRPFVLPGQPTKYARDLKFKINRSRLEFDLDFGTKSISGRATHTIEPIEQSIDSVEFDASEMNFGSVKVNGRIAKYETRKHSISVDLSSPLSAGSEATVEIEYSATPRKGLYFRGPTKDFPDRTVHAFSHGQAEDSKYWFPCYDYPNMRTSTEIVVKAPSNMTVIANGRLVSVSEKDSAGKKMWHFSQEIPHVSYLVSIIVGDYEKLGETHDGISVEYYVPSSKKPLASLVFRNTGRMLDFFASVTGAKYPYAKYSQTVVSDFMYGGMENISATTLTERTLHDKRAHLDFTSDNLVSHELAHQWFGDYLTCRDWSHAWLNEGFATYFNALFMEANEGVDYFQYHMKTNQDNLDDEISERYQRPIVTKRYWDADELFDRHTYEKGSWVLNGLRGLLGDNLFFRGIAHYVSNHKNSIVETSDFRKALEKVSGLNLEPFFEQWLYSPGYPEYSVAYTWNDDSKLAQLEFEQTKADNEGVPLFTNPIDIMFTFKEGLQVTKRVLMKEKRTAFFFSFDSPPVNVNVDPKNWILKKLKFNKPKEMFLHQLKNDQNAMERVRAAKELAAFHTDDVIEPLACTIENDKFWGVRLESARALGEVGTRKALEVLLEKKNHKDHKVRRGVAAGLRSFAQLEHNEEAIDALIELLNNDESYYTRAYAAESLGYYKKSEKALEALKSAILQDSFDDYVRYRAFIGFAECKDPRLVLVAIDYLMKGKDFRGRTSAATALGKMGRGVPGVLDALLSQQYDFDVRVRDEAAAAVGELGDNSVMPDLESWLSSEPEGRCRRRLREAIYRLKQGMEQSEAVAKLNQRVEKLTEENKKLMEKIQALEAKAA